MHISLFRVGMDFLSSLLLFVFDQKSHFATLVLERYELLVLCFHCFFIFTLFELQLPERFFGNAQFLPQFAYLLVIVTMSLQLR